MWKNLLFYVHFTKEGIFIVLTRRGRGEKGVSNLPAFLTGPPNPSKVCGWVNVSVGVGVGMGVDVGVVVGCLCVCVCVSASVCAMVVGWVGVEKGGREEGERGRDEDGMHGGPLRGLVKTP